MNLALWVALIFGIIAFLTGFFKQVSLLVLIVRSFLSGLIIYILISLLSFGLKRIENLSTHERDKATQNYTKEQSPSDLDDAAEGSKMKSSQVDRDLIARLSQDPVRGAELVRKMALDDQFKNQF
ncbi:MAG: hypothetical protein QHH75_02715 [Bacillota bacterium]|nr:hypothetical protein [Bacillota bacterium]